MQVMAFDYGNTKIGVAVGNTITSTSMALAILKTKVLLNTNFKEIQDLINNWNPELLIVGVPISDNQDQSIIKAAQNFANTLSLKFSLPIELVDESYSSLEAYSEYKELRQQGFKRRSNIDNIAAKIILERWFLQSK